MREGMSGSLVYKLDPLAPASKSLRLNDVVLAIEEVPVADDSTIEFREEERLEFTYHVRNKHVGAMQDLPISWTTHCNTASYIWPEAHLERVKISLENFKCPAFLSCRVVLEPTSSFKQRAGLTAACMQEISSDCGF